MKMNYLGFSEHRWTGLLLVLRFVRFPLTHGADRCRCLCELAAELDWSDYCYYRWISSQRIHRRPRAYINCNAARYTRHIGASSPSSRLIGGLTVILRLRPPADQTCGGPFF